MNRISPSLEMLPKAWFVLIALVAFGAFLRIFEIGAQSLWIDEGFTLTQAVSISHHGYPLLDSGFIEKKDPLLAFLLAPLASQWDAFSPSLPRSVVAFFGSLAIVVAFLVGNTLSGKSLGIVFAFLISFSSIHIAWSRQIRGYEVAVFFVLLAMFSLARAAKTSRIVPLTQSILSSGGAALSKSFGILFLSAVISFLLASWNAPRSKHVFRLISVFCSLLLIIFFTAFFHFASFNHPLYLPHYVFGALWGSLGILFVLAILGFIHSMKDTPLRALHLSFGVFLLTTILFFSFLVPVQEDRYLLLANPIVLFYAASCIVSLGSRLPIRQALAIPIILLVIAATDAVSIRALRFVPTKTVSLGHNTPQSPFRGAYAAIMEELHPEDAIISPYPFLDRLYLGRSTFAIPISYTGRPLDSSVLGKREYYSGTVNLFAEGAESAQKKLASLRKRGDIYLVMDSLAIRRVHASHLDTATQDADIIYRDMFFNGEEHEVLVYRIPKILTSIPIPDSSPKSRPAP